MACEEQLNVECTSGTSESGCIPWCRGKYHGYQLLLNIGGEDSKMSCELHHSLYSLLVDLPIGLPPHTLFRRRLAPPYHTSSQGCPGQEFGRPGHPGSPNNKGFDHFFGFDNQGFAHFYYPEYLWRNNQKVLYPDNHNLRVDGEYIRGKGTYSHDEFAKEALQFIRDNKDNPFFLDRKSPRLNSSHW